MATLKSREEIAGEYNICVRTLNNWIRDAEIPIRKKRALTLKEVKLIYETFGYPSDRIKTEYLRV
jgi:hypothetical protein